MLPFYQSITNRLTRLLRHKQICITSGPYKTLRPCLRSVKDPLALNVPAVHEIPCEWGSSYVGQAGRLILLRIKEHRRHVWLAQTDKSTVAYHCWLEDHQAQFSKTQILYCLDNWKKCTIRESLEMALMSPLMHQEEGVRLSSA